MLAGLLSIVLLSCADDPLATPCGVAGRQLSCSCPAGANGIQTCGFDGHWQKCKCYQTSNPAGAAAVSGGGSRADGSSGSGGASAATGGGTGGARAGAGGGAGIATAGAGGRRPGVFGGAGR
jgi:hypothetical protein